MMPLGSWARSAAAVAAAVLAASAKATIEAAAAVEPEVAAKLLATDDACEGTGADAEQCSLSLRQLRGKQQQAPIDMYIPTGMAAMGKLASRGMSPDNGPPRDTVDKELTGAASDYRPVNPELLEPSGAPLLTFYMYRAAADEVYPPLNANAANLAGVLWYLHHEVVVQYPRKFGITKIVRMEVQVKATKPLHRKGMNFGVRTAFDRGQATGPFVCGRKVNNASNKESGMPEPDFCEGAFTEANGNGLVTLNGQSYGGPFEWGAFGFFVGCNKLGDFPFPTYPVYYPDAIWYSLPGPCPSTPSWGSNPECLSKEPGGYCKEPTGTGDCTWNYNITGEISINELVGIEEKEWPSFMDEGKKEYDPYTQKGTQFSWWNDINDVAANTRRIKAAQALFKAKYPDQTPDENLPHPACDFNEDEFYHEYYMRNPSEGDSAPCEDGHSIPSCVTAIEWIKSDGIYAHPEWYPGLSNKSSFAELQKKLWMEAVDDCPRPCGV